MHNNVINMIIAKRTEFVDNKEKSTPVVFFI